MRLIKESFSSNNLRGAINAMNQRVKHDFLGDLGYISTYFDQDISTFDDSQIVFIYDIEKLDVKEDFFMYNLDKNTWNFPLKSNFSYYLSDYDPGNKVSFNTITSLPDGVVLMADLTGGSLNSTQKVIGVKCTDNYGDVYLLQEVGDGAAPYILGDTIFSRSWSVRYAGSVGDIYIAVPKYEELYFCYEEKLGRLRESNKKLDSQFKIDVSPKKTDGLFTIDPFQDIKLRDIKHLPKGPCLVFYYRKFKSTDLKRKMDKRIKDTKPVKNIIHYTDKIIGKHSGDIDYLVKYFMGREYKLFYIIQTPSPHLIMYMNLSRIDIYTLDFYSFYEKTLNILGELKKSRWFNEIMELNNVVTKKINSYDINDPSEREALKYYIKMVKEASLGLLISADREFKSKYKIIKNISL